MPATSARMSRWWADMSPMAGAPSRSFPICPLPHDPEDRGLQRNPGCDPRANFLHLWHESFRRHGLDKWAAPPPGSFLHDVCQELGTLERFRRSSSEAELKAFIAEVAA